MRAFDAKPLIAAFRLGGTTAALPYLAPRRLKTAIKKAPRFGYTSNMLRAQSDALAWAVVEAFPLLPGYCWEFWSERSDYDTLANYSPSSYYFEKISALAALMLPEGPTPCNCASFVITARFELENAMFKLKEVEIVD